MCLKSRVVLFLLYKNKTLQTSRQAIHASDSVLYIKKKSYHFLNIQRVSESSAVVPLLAGRASGAKQWMKERLACTEKCEDADFVLKQTEFKRFNTKPSVRFLLSRTSVEIRAQKIQSFQRTKKCHATLNSDYYDVFCLEYRTPTKIYVFIQVKPVFSNWQHTRELLHHLREALTRAEETSALTHDSNKTITA